VIHREHRGHPKTRAPFRLEITQKGLNQESRGTYPHISKSGEMDIPLTLIRFKPYRLDQNNVVIPISSDQRRYNLKYKVTSQKNGLFYIRLLIKLRMILKLVPI